MIVDNVRRPSSVEHNGRDKSGPYRWRYIAGLKRQKALSRSIGMSLLGVLEYLKTISGNLFFQQILRMYYFTKLPGKVDRIIVCIHLSINTISPPKLAGNL